MADEYKPFVTHGSISPEDAREMVERGDVVQLITTIGGLGHSKSVSTFYYWRVYVIDRRGRCFEVSPVYVEYIGSWPEQRVADKWKGVYRKGKGWYITSYGTNRLEEILRLIFGDALSKVRVISHL